MAAAAEPGKEVKPGDLIEIFRRGYQHWAVYVGGGYVVHFVPHWLGAGTGDVVKYKLEHVVRKYRWRVNNRLDDEYKPRPADDIVKKACSLVDTEMQYDLLKYNEEHFATDMRYGKPESQQVRNAAAAGAGAVGAAAGVGARGAELGAELGAAAGVAMGARGAQLGAATGAAMGARGAEFGAAAGAVVGAAAGVAVGAAAAGVEGWIAALERLVLN